ncbi:hypothetical protein HMPREF0322_04338, partial [Desulfitobacterium hafniense DP7]
RKQCFRGFLYEKVKETMHIARREDKVVVNLYKNIEKIRNKTL